MLYFNVMCQKLYQYQYTCKLYKGENYINISLKVKKKHEYTCTDLKNGSATIESIGIASLSTSSEC